MLILQTHRHDQADLDFDINIYNDQRSTLGHKNLKFGRGNVNGLLHELTEILFLLKEVNFDVLGVFETHLCDEITDNMISLPDYGFIRRNRLHHMVEESYSIAKKD